MKRDIFILFYWITLILGTAFWLLGRFSEIVFLTVIGVILLFFTGFGLLIEAIKFERKDHEKIA
jgi:hypothetical protein